MHLFINITGIKYVAYIILLLYFAPTKIYENLHNCIMFSLRFLTAAELANLNLALRSEFQRN